MDVDSNPSPAPQTSRAKKVRSACERCRDRRIKCDGQVPACGQCSKAKVPCIDVDSRSSAGRVSRASQANTYARIEWLENIVKSRLPDVDLSEAPNAGSEIFQTQGEVQSQTDANRGTKRRRETTGHEGDDETSVANKARLMALNLGLLALNANGSQVHYVGSSSGSFFASFLQNESHGNPYNHTDLGSDYGHTQDVAIDLCESETTPEGGDSKIRALYDTLRAELPSKKDCNVMVHEFFAHWHADYPVLHKPSFFSLIDGLYHVKESSSDLAHQHNGWPADLVAFDYNGESLSVDSKRCIPIPIHTAAAQLFYVLSIAALLQIRRRRFLHNPARYYEQASSLSQVATTEVSIPSLQLVLLHVLHSFLSPEGGRTWISLHMAMAFTVDLGLHREVGLSGRFSKTALQMRRRIFHSTYSLDRWVSTIQGRPLGFGDSGLDMSFSSLEESPAVQGLDLEDQAFMPYSITRFQWAQILSLVKDQFYRFPDPSKAFPDVKMLQAEITERLENWLTQATRVIETLPQKTRARLTIKSRINYHAARCLLFQPSQLNVRPGGEEIHKCFQSAVQRLRLWSSLYDLGHLPISWPTMHGVFMSGATLIYCVWYSTGVRDTVSLAVLAKDFRLCSSLLTAGGEWWPLVRRSKSSFERLADYTLRSLTDSNGRLHQTNEQRTMGQHDPVLPDQEEMMGMNASPAGFEQILQSVLQYDMQLPDVLDAFEHSPFFGGNSEWSAPDFFPGGEFGTSMDELIALGLADNPAGPTNNTA